MNSFLEEKKSEKKGINYGLLIGAAVGLVLIVIVAAFIAMQPPAADQHPAVLLHQNPVYRSIGSARRVECVVDRSVGVQTCNSPS